MLHPLCFPFLNNYLFYFSLFNKTGGKSKVNIGGLSENNCFPNCVSPSADQHYSAAAENEDAFIFFPPNSNTSTLIGVISHGTSFPI